MKIPQEILRNIKAIDAGWQEKAQAYMDSLAMPPGALGQLQHTALKLATIQQTLKPQLTKKSLIMACADHGVTTEGVSAYPQITNAIVNTALAGGAAINAFCKQAEMDLIVLDVGVKGRVNPPKQINPNIQYYSKCIAPGTANMLFEAAMTEEQCDRAILTGIAIASQSNANVLALGEMGIGNTTSASCLLAKFCDLSAKEVTGPGTGVTGANLQHKQNIIQQILERCSQVKDPLETLRQVGGLEIAALVGVILGAASHQKAIILDGFISGAAALVAQVIAPNSKQYMFAGHRSSEPGHRLILEKLALEPLVQLNLRLGEGTGAALATNSLEAACEFLSSMMTLEEALSLQ